MKLVIKDDWGFNSMNNVSDHIEVTDDPILDEKDAAIKRFNLQILRDKMAWYEALDPSKSLKLRKRIYLIQRAVDMLVSQLAVWNTHVE